MVGFANGKALLVLLEGVLVCFLMSRLRQHSSTQPKILRLLYLRNKLLTAILGYLSIALSEDTGSWHLLEFFDYSTFVAIFPLGKDH
jgi:hypothetical protein